MSLNTPLSHPTEPFYFGVGVSGDVPALMPVSLGGHAYMTDTPKIRRETLDVLRPAWFTESEPGDAALNTAGVWKISGSDWRHGAGQIFFDSKDSDRRMYGVSKGIDPWTRERLSMLPDTTQVLAAPSTPLRLVSIGNELWAAGNGVLKRTTTATAPSPTWTAVTVSAPLTAATILECCTDGSRVYTAHGALGIGRAAKGAAAITQFSTYPATKVWFANGRLFAYRPGELVEISGAGVPGTPLWTGGYGGDGVVISVVGSPSCVFIAYNTVDRGELLCVGENATTGALAVPLFAGELNKGETFNELVYYQDLLLAATSRGLRVGTLGDNGHSASFGPVLPLGPIGGAATFGQYAWIIWNSYDSLSHGLGRADLSVFTEPLVPAYASDLMIPLATGPITDLVTHVGQPFFAVDGAGIYTAHPSALVPSATIRSGFIRFGTFERKVAVSLDVRHDPLQGQVMVGVCDENGFDHDVGVSDAPDSLGPATELSSANLIGEALEVCLTFLANTALTMGPVLRRWSLRAMTIGWRTDAIELPLWIRSRVLTADGSSIGYDTLDEWQFLKSLEAERTVVTLVMGDLSESVVIDKVGLEPERWLEHNHWFEGVTIVRLLTINQAGH